MILLFEEIYDVFENIVRKRISIISGRFLFILLPPLIYMISVSF
jgi:hypothetical protein